MTHVNNTIQDMHDSARELDVDQEGFSKNQRTKDFSLLEHDSPVGCLKITEDKSCKSRIQTLDARLIIATSAAPRREG